MDAYREGWELDLSTVHVPVPSAKIKHSEGQRFVSIDEFREKYYDEKMPPYPWDAGYDDWVIKNHAFNDSDEHIDVTVFTQTEAIPHTCTASIERILAGPADWKSIVGSGIKYLD